MDTLRKYFDSLTPKDYLALAGFGAVGFMVVLMFGILGAAAIMAVGLLTDNKKEDITVFMGMTAGAIITLVIFIFS